MSPKDRPLTIKVKAVLRRYLPESTFGYLNRQCVDVYVILRHTLFVIRRAERGRAVSSKVVGVLNYLREGKQMLLTGDWWTVRDNGVLNFDYAAIFILA